MITIVPMGGLANKLRVVFSYYQLALKRRRCLEVIWKVDSVCNGYFLDYFQEINGIKFRREHVSGNRITYRGCSVHPEFPANYEKLRLKPTLQLQKILTKKREILQPKYIAVHIRRTDHISLAKGVHKFTPDEEFINFINQYPEHNIYLATDNRATQDKFIVLYGTRIKGINLISNNANLRKTTLRDAIQDIYLCKEAEYFKGTGWSSFSDLIDNLRKLN